MILGWEFYNVGDGSWTIFFLFSFSFFSCSFLISVSFFLMFAMDYYALPIQQNHPSIQEVHSMMILL